jgi:hypothetical protein
VNLKYITEFNRSEGEVILENELKAMISLDRTEEFLEKMQLLQ